MLDRAQGTPCPVAGSITGARVSSHEHTAHTRPYRRRGRKAVSLATLFALPPLRREVPEGAYTAAAPLCWWSRERWLAHVAALYDQHYRRLRSEGRIPSVARATFLSCMADMSAGADNATGRGCRVPVGGVRRDGTCTGLVATVGKCKRQIQRARQIAAVLGIYTVVQQGRLRTYEERIASHERQDRCRGWAQVSVLHESATMPVDNSTVDELLQQGNVTPLLRRSGKLFFPRMKNSSSPTNMKKRRAPRGRDATRPARRRPAYDPKVLLVAVRLTEKPETPAWVARRGPRSWAPVLTKYVRAGWDEDDVLEAIREHHLAHKVPHSLTNPWGFLSHILGKQDIDCPPAAIIKAEAAAHNERRREQQRQMRAEIRRRNQQAAPPESAARRAAVAAEAKRSAAMAQRRAERRAEERRREDQARAELAARQRQPSPELYLPLGWQS